MTIDPQHIGDWRWLGRDVVDSYLEPKGIVDEYVARLQAAMEIEDLEEVDHLTAVMITMMSGRGRDVQALSQRWGWLSKEYHNKFCTHDKCEARRAEVATTE